MLENVPPYYKKTNNYYFLNNVQMGATYPFKYLH